MEKFTSKDKQIFEDMNQCVKDLGLKILDEQVIEDSLSGFSTFEYPGYNMGIIFSYHPSHNMAEVVLRYADLPAEKLPALYELLNHINGHLTVNHFQIDPVLRILALRSGMKVTGYFLNKEAFKAVLTQNLGSGHIFVPLIAKLVFTDQTPQSIMDEFYESKEIAPLKLKPDEKIKMPEVSAEHPYIIHGCKDIPAFPTHTHGLTELGMPEFLIDHLAFGTDQNGGLINASYDSFTKPENAGKLDAIRNGETVKLRDKDLKPPSDHPDPYVYCYRRVYPEFEMVKHAYNIDDQNNQSDADPTAWFIQIYVEEDDFALTDDYYRGGIKW